MTETPFRWRQIVIPAFGPSLLFGISNGAILPVIALSAIALGASHAMSGVIAALIGFGSLMCNIPAAVITSRFGERRSLMGAAVVGACALAICIQAHHPAVLALGVFLMGMATSVFYLARQAFLMEAVPLSMRARAFSTLGGTQRMGMFIGPFAAAGLMHFIGLNGAYLVAIVALLGAGALSFVLPELQPRAEDSAVAQPRPRMATIAAEHKRVFLTLGLGCMLIAAMRASRQVAIPLWADAIGLSPTTTALIFGCVSSIDMLVFYPAGKIMDQYGRLWVALPCALTLAVSLLAIPLTATMIPFVLVCLLMGLGNGIGSGIVMTLGADGAPANARHEFLGIWRLITDTGTSAGPFILSGITALLSLGAGIAVIGTFGLGAACIFWRALPHTHAVKDA
ncbi:MFS transporter [Pollutimonas harenae]|uniref:MFS transporter n=1 Tax=Pollutimonas harenae TaxID=657015 RepID=A0A853GWJ1_9BURK|nr:MFS transporter [Pollutimonas harenae]NYT84120.1 MFS transporter [Pollutimonas harenae]TEA73667.1 MFS transporter [Pollutimonas harenae]